MTLRRLYLALILPKLQYGSILFANASNTQLLKLNRIQFAAARTILGALRCTLTVRLEAEANLLPLDIRRRLQLVQYGSRVVNTFKHPVNTLINHYMPPFCSFPTELLPAVGRLREEFRLIHLQISQIPNYHTKNNYLTSSLPVYSTMSLSKKSDLSSSQWMALFSDMCHNKYASQSKVYCDGSLQGNRRGCGVWSDSSIMARLPLHCSIYTAELYAIYCAVKFVSVKCGSFVIFSDSLSAIISLQSLDTKEHFLLSWIHLLFNSIEPGKIVLEWVPSHMGIHGNDQADKLARLSLQLSNITELQFSKKEPRTLFRTYYYNSWQHNWSELPKNLTEFKPILGPIAFSDINRIEQVSLSRLRLGVCPLTRRHYYSGVPQSHCNSCGCVMTIRHLLVDCPDFTEARAPITKFCLALKIPLTVNSLLSTQIPSTLLMQYLKEAKCLDLI